MLSRMKWGRGRISVLDDWRQIYRRIIEAGNKSLLGIERVVAEFDVDVKGAEETVVLKVVQTMNGRYAIRSNYLVRQPGAAGPYMPSNEMDSPAEALKLALAYLAGIEDGAEWVKFP